MKAKRLIQTLAIVIVACTLSCTACASPPVATPLASPLGSPLATDIPIPRPTQDPKLGRVTGRLLLRSGSGSQPVAGRILYLAGLTRDASGVETAAGIDRANSPRTFSDVDGSFVFPNVPPGRYALVMDLVRNAFMLRKPGENADLIVTVTEGGTAEFGTLTYDDLPG